MAQTKYVTREGILHLDSQGRLHYDAGARPAYLACGNATELARATAYALGANIIIPLADGATTIYHVYTCTTAGTSHASTQPAAFATGAGHRFPSGTAITDGTAAFTYSYTPDQGFYVNGTKTGRYLTKRNGVVFDTQFSNDKLHSTDAFAYAEYAAGSTAGVLAYGRYFVNGEEVLSKNATTYISPTPSVLLMTSPDILSAEGYTEA